MNNEQRQQQVINEVRALMADGQPRSIHGIAKTIKRCHAAVRCAVDVLNMESRVIVTNSCQRVVYSTANSQALRRWQGRARYVA